MASIRAAQPTIQALLKSNDFCSALDLIANTRDSLRVTVNADRGCEITCLRNLDAQLVEITKFINHMVISEFESALCSFLALSSSTEAADLSVSEVQKA